MPDIRDRINSLRETLKLSQSDFGSKLSLERSSISLIERKQRNVTDRVIADICREFNVNEDWLRTGEGNMFAPTDFDDELMAYCADICGGDDEFIKNYIVTYMKLTDEQKAFMRKLVRNLADMNETKK